MTRPQAMPSSIPEPHRRFLQTAIDALQEDPRIVGVAVGGSFLSNTMDEFSDLDLVIASEPLHADSVMDDRQRIAGSFGPLLAAFTGEHVGESRLLICLYAGIPPLHVDLKFVALPDLANRIEDPAVLWERGDQFTRALNRGAAAYPYPDTQWIEDRFWVWVHYAATKIGRGEIFEALEFLSFLRATVLGPLAVLKSGGRPAGVRRVEKLATSYVRELQATIAGHDAVECVRALEACVDAYGTLRVSGTTVERRHAAELAARQYLSEVAERCRESPARGG